MVYLYFDWLDYGLILFGQSSSTIDQERATAVICSWALLVKSPPATRRTRRTRRGQQKQDQTQPIPERNVLLPMNLVVADPFWLYD
jgi:hypothetical protein